MMIIVREGLPGCSWRPSVFAVRGQGWEDSPTRKQSRIVWRLQTTWQAGMAACMSIMAMPEVCLLWLMMGVRGSCKVADDTECTVEEPVSKMIHRYWQVWGWDRNNCCALRIS